MMGAKKTQRERKNMLLLKMDKFQFGLQFSWF